MQSNIGSESERNVDEFTGKGYVQIKTDMVPQLAAAWLIHVTNIRLGLAFIIFKHSA